MTEENNFKDVDQPKEGFQLLLDSKYPLLQEFREKCPGTFKHCQSLATMVEGVSISLGLDVTYMRVASLYHDVGKIINPGYFTENQLNDDNPHDKLDPQISYQIISRHVSDTAMILLNDDNFPRDLIKIVIQHHGTSVMSHFFGKSGSDVEDYFRYRTEKPTCVESAILMICDCIEARSRAEIQAGKYNFDPTYIIEDTINSLMADSQLDNVVMRLGDLQKIKIAIAKELEGTFQKRVNYKKSNKEKEESTVSDSK